MTVRIQLKFGNEIAFASLARSPDFVSWSGNEEVVEDVLFSLDSSYGTAGHAFVTGIETTALDLATALVHRYGQENIDVVEGADVLEKEEKELATIEKTGNS
jgi:hypothetical protein